MSFLKRFSFFSLPSVFQTVISVTILPFITLRLGPEDYGIFSLILSCTAIGTTIASSGSGFLFSSNYTEVDEKEKCLLVSTVVITGISLTLTFSSLVIFLWDRIGLELPVFLNIPLPALYLGLMTLIFGLPWIFAADILTLEGRASLFAGTLVTQALFSAGATLVSLFIFDQGFLSLLWGSFAGSLVSFFCALFALKNVLRMNFSLNWFFPLLKLSLVTVPANILETFQVLLERVVLTNYVGLSNLGIYTHSQQYRSLVMMPVKAAARTIWPVMLSEAREKNSHFYKTMEVWNVLYLGITMCGIVFATLGREVIAFLTNGKFSEAHILATLWMVYLLIQNMGKPLVGVLWAKGHAKVYSGLHACALIFGIAALFLLVPYFDLYGAFSALLIQMLTFRILLQWYVRKINFFPFQDGGVIFGSGAILFTLGISQYCGFTFFQNLFLLLGMSVLIGLVSRNILQNVVLRFLSDPNEFASTVLR